MIDIVLWMFVNLYIPQMPLLRKLDLGNVQELLTWIVALMALIFAKRAADAGAEAARIARRTDDKQQAQLARMELERRESQAQLIAAWGDPFTNEGPQYRVSNQSGQPVFEFYVWHTESSTQSGAMGSRVLPPGEFYVGLEFDESRAMSPFSLMFDMPVEYVFTDARRQRWHRTASGELNPVSNYPELARPVLTVLVTASDSGSGATSG